MSSKLEFQSPPVWQPLYDKFCAAEPAARPREVLLALLESGSVGMKDQVLARKLLKDKTHVAASTARRHAEKLKEKLDRFFGPDGDGASEKVCMKIVSHPYRIEFWAMEAHSIDDGAKGTSIKNMLKQFFGYVGDPREGVIIVQVDPIEKVYEQQPVIKANARGPLPGSITANGFPSSVANGNSSLFELYSGTVVASAASETLVFTATNLGGGPGVTVEISRRGEGRATPRREIWPKGETYVAADQPCPHLAAWFGVY